MDSRIIDYVVRVEKSCLTPSLTPLNNTVLFYDVNSPEGMESGRTEGNGNGYLVDRRRMDYVNSSNTVQKSRRTDIDLYLEWDLLQQ